MVQSSLQVVDETAAVSVTQPQAESLRAFTLTDSEGYRTQLVGNTGRSGNTGSEKRKKGLIEMGL